MTLEWSFSHTLLCLSSASFKAFYGHSIIHCCTPSSNFCRLLDGQQKVFLSGRLKRGDVQPFHVQSHVHLRMLYFDLQLALDPALHAVARPSNAQGCIRRYSLQKKPAIKKEKVLQMLVDELGQAGFIFSNRC